MARTLTFLYLILGAATVALQIGFGRPVAALFTVEGRQGHIEVDIALGVAVGLVVVLTSQWAGRRWRWARTLSDYLRGVIEPLRPGDVLGIAVLSAVVEEMFFRGFLQPHLGLWVTSLIFGVIHQMKDQRNISWSVSAIVMGLILGSLFEARGSLIGPIIMHFVINYFNLHHLLAMNERETA